MPTPRKIPVTRPFMLQHPFFKPIACLKSLFENEI